MSKCSSWDMGVSASDFHFPFIDEKNVELLLQFLKREQPRWFVINGDLMDCWEISRFDKNPKSGVAFAEEIEQVKKFLQKVRKLIPKTTIIYVAGNHEFRLRKYIISNAKELHGLKGLTIPEQLGLKELNIEYIDCPEGMSRFGHAYWKTGYLHIGHFDKVSKHAGYTAKSLLDDLGVSVIQGHVHRFGISSKTLLDGTELMGVEQGCMCDLIPSYMSHANWQAGFSIFYRKKTSPRFQIYPVRISDYEFFSNGYHYKVKR